MVFKAKKRRSIRRSRERVRSKGKMTIPLAVVLGFAPLVGNGINQVRANGWGTGLKNSVSYLIPYNPTTGKFTAANLGGGLVPALAGVAVHKIVGGVLGVNRMLASHHIPFLRI